MAEKSVKKLISKINIKNIAKSVKLAINKIENKFK